MTPAFYRRAFVLLILAGCSREPVSTWMIGTFSGEPTLDSDGTFTNREFFESGYLEHRQFIYGKLSTVTNRRWRQEGGDLISIEPGPDENAGFHWTFERRGTCGPFVWRTSRDGEPTPTEIPLVRGELCPRANPDACVGCSGWILERCEGEPPPCDDGTDESADGSE